MSQVVNQHYARLKHALSRRSASDIDQLPVLWQQLNNCLPLKPGLERSNWRAVTSSYLLDGVIGLLDQTIQCDTTVGVHTLESENAIPYLLLTRNASFLSCQGMASSFAARCMTACASLADSAAPLVNPMQRGEALAFSHKCVENIPSIVQRWWKKLSPLTSKWMQQGTLTRNIEMFLILLDFCGIHSRHSPQITTFLYGQCHCIRNGESSLTSLWQRASCFIFCGTPRLPALCRNIFQQV